MKTKNLFPCLAVALRRRILPALIAVLNLLPAGRMTAQTFATLHSFTAASCYNCPNSDGANPGAVLLSGNTLYGTAYWGGSSGNGILFAVNTDGTGFTNLHSFTGSDGARPYARLITNSSGNTLYGTADGGGNSDNGTVFAVNTDGTGFTNLHKFAGSDGADPSGGLVSSGNTLYGAAYNGGSNGNGTVFKVNANSTGFTTLHSFTATTDPYPSANTDGAHPYGGLILSGATLYGTAYYGGSAGYGTVFAVNTDGTGFTNLHSFTYGDGQFPQAGLLLSDNTLYGTTVFGGDLGMGTVFAVKTDGTGFTSLYSFSSYGASPYGGLILLGNTLYGTTYAGTSSGNGAIFALNTDGTGYSILHSFTGGSDGAHPETALVLSGNTLYGTTVIGGSWVKGTVFSLSFRPQLTLTPFGANVILSWPTNVAGFDYTGYRLQSAHAITGSFAIIPASESPYTIPIASAQQFFRLSK